MLSVIGGHLEVRINLFVRAIYAHQPGMAVVLKQHASIVRQSSQVPQLTHKATEILPLSCCAVTTQH